MDCSNIQIVTAEILSIQTKEKDHLVMQAIINSKMTEFEFRMVYHPELKSTLIMRSENFRSLAKYNSSFENTVHDLIKKAYHGETIKLPIKLTF